eukprot:TRINITY_DN1684_c1_g2_i2.p1 TRINITY_DN1684_c1_g2~~TRINITY_DN1684_c1_g2_i2.p1  ORF type:complete len:678 (-),score=132.69 TRINITY_DN1684_c1_g2_i2:254-2287(-)
MSQSELCPPETAPEAVVVSTGEQLYNIDECKLTLQRSKDAGPSIRSLVSKKKIRYHDGKFDLDLAYITDRIIAMGFPSENLEGVYRNPMKQVQKFLKERHPDHYRIYNLCSERDYDDKKFEGRVARFPFDDHNCPPLEMIANFSKDLANWLDESEENIGVIHCKAGKGRTGLMICAFLVYRYQSYGITAKDAQDFYAERRTRNQKGVTIPSQKRFVYYYERMLRENYTVEDVATPTLLLTTVTLTNVTFSSDPTFTMKHRGEVFTSTEPPISKILPNHKRELQFKLNKVVRGENKFQFYDKDGNSLFYFWIHATFVDDYKFVLQKDEIDGIKKSKLSFPSDFTIQVAFEDAPAWTGGPAPEPGSGIFSHSGREALLNLLGPDGAEVLANLYPVPAPAPAPAPVQAPRPKPDLPPSSPLPPPRTSPSPPSPPSARTAEPTPAIKEESSLKQSDSQPSLVPRDDDEIDDEVGIDDETESENGQSQNTTPLASPVLPPSQSNPLFTNLRSPFNLSPGQRQQPVAVSSMPQQSYANPSKTPPNYVAPPPNLARRTSVNIINTPSNGFSNGNSPVGASSTLPVNLPRDPSAPPQPVHYKSFNHRRFEQDPEKALNDFRSRRQTTAPDLNSAGGESTFVTGTVNDNNAGGSANIVNLYRANLAANASGVKPGKPPRAHRTLPR